MRTITKIDAKLADPIERKRVAAYARVSSGKEAMLHSMSAQVSYYNNYIGKRGDWEFAGIYADEAMTGTKAMRPEFQRLLTDCRAGKIDMVITKSITRFARNTVTLLETARELRLLGIDIFFERENIYTLSADGELMLTLLASFAQEESRSVSENCKWHIRKGFAEGKPYGLHTMLGYRIKHGEFQVIPEEAEIVRTIFALYLSGMGKTAIAKALREQGIQLAINTIAKILINATYAGGLLLQRTFVADHLTKHQKPNKGELPMYHIEEHHEAIVERSVFNDVQGEISKRSIKPPARSTKPGYPFTGLIRCGKCGAAYLRKHTAIGTKYGKIVWICNTFNKLGKTMCASQQIPEDILCAKIAEIMDLPEFDETLMRSQISEIQIPEHNRLICVFKDGHIVTADWQNPSRRESWTAEMRQAARKRQIEINKRRLGK